MELSELEGALWSADSAEAWVTAVGRYLQGHELSFGHGTDNAMDEAYWLVRARQGWESEAWEERPDPDLIPGVLEIARRRVVERKPLAYLLGEAWFAGLRLDVDERVLIPRSPLAELIEGEFLPWCRLRAADRILDVGTGSGCLAVAIAHHCAGVQVDATDLSADALTIAQANLKRHGLQRRVRLFRADLFPAPRSHYRVIVSNPPYVPARRLRELPAEYAHEPVLALEAGSSGLDIVARLLEGAAEYLTPDGMLVVEVGEAQEAFMAAYPRLPVIWLEFERGGEGVFMLTRNELTGYLHD